MTPPTTEQVTNKRVQVANGDTPSADRFVSLTTHRLLATTCYVVAVIDGTNRLADPKSFLVTPDYQRARRHANRLTQRLGKVEPTHYAEHLAPRVRGTRRSYGLPKPPKRIAQGPIAYVEPPRRHRSGKWEVAWSVVGSCRENVRRFATRQGADDFHSRLQQEMAS